MNIIYNITYGDPDVRYLLKFFNCGLALAEFLLKNCGASLWSLHAHKKKIPGKICDCSIDMQVINRKTGEGSSDKWLIDWKVIDWFVLPDTRDSPHPRWRDSSGLKLWQLWAAETCTWNREYSAAFSNTPAHQCNWSEFLAQVYLVPYFKRD